MGWSAGIVINEPAHGFKHFAARLVAIRLQMDRARDGNDRRSCSGVRAVIQIKILSTAIPAKAVKQGIAVARSETDAGRVAEGGDPQRGMRRLERLRDEANFLHVEEFPVIAEFFLGPGGSQQVM